jgi:2-oxoglutarate/2-oxoacid ferredoxin oxidoreductase subunit beta
MTDIQTFKSGVIPTWCPGCENYIIFAAIEAAAKELQIPRENFVLVYDIGCIGNIADFFKVYGIHSLHGRCIATAVGVKLANPKLTVIVIGGDGGVYGEGLNHLLSAARLNIEITVMVANNHLYSLTTGQTSPTTPLGSKTKSTPKGAPSIALNPIPLITAVNPAVYARHIEGHGLAEAASAVKEAVTTPGFALLDMDQVCVTFGKQLSS